MAKVKAKGTTLSITIGNAAVAVAQVIGITLPEMEAETYESDTLDNTDAGIPYEPTGRTEGGSLSAELFFDPALAGHQNLLDWLTTPRPADGTRPGGTVVFPTDNTNTTWTFSGAGFGIGGAVALKEGLKANIKVKLSKIPTFQ